MNSPSPATMSQHKAWDWNSAVLNFLREPRLNTYLWCQRTRLLPCVLEGRGGGRPYLVCLDKVKVFPMDPEAMFKVSTFFLAPGTKLIYSRKGEELEERYRT